MKVLKSAAAVLRSGCVIFTIISLLFFSLGAILAARDIAANSDINVRSLWMFFLFSVLLAAANKILSAEKLALPLRMLIHFAASLAIYFVTVILFGDYISNSSQVLVALVLFLAVYLVCAVFIVINMRRKKRRAGEKNGYVSQFK